MTMVPKYAPHSANVSAPGVAALAVVRKSCAGMAMPKAYSDSPLCAVSDSRPVRAHA